MAQSGTVTHYAVLQSSPPPGLEAYVRLAAHVADAMGPHEGQGVQQLWDQVLKAGPEYFAKAVSHLSSVSLFDVIIKSCTQLPQLTEQQAAQYLQSNYFNPTLFYKLADDYGGDHLKTVVSYFILSTLTPREIIDNSKKLIPGTHSNINKQNFDKALVSPTAKTARALAEYTSCVEPGLRGNGTDRCLFVIHKLIDLYSAALPSRDYGDQLGAFSLTRIAQGIVEQKHLTPRLNPCLIPCARDSALAKELISVPLPALPSWLSTAAQTQAGQPSHQKGAVL